MPLNLRIADKDRNQIGSLLYVDFCKLASAVTGIPVKINQKRRMIELLINTDSRSEVNFE